MDNLFNYFINSQFWKSPKTFQMNERKDHVHVVQLGSNVPCVHPVNRSQMLAQCWKLNINKFGHGHITLKCAFYSTFNFLIYVQINKWLIDREKICVLNGNTDSKILLNPCKETFLYKHFCGNFSDISAFKVNIFYNEKYRYFESTPW